MTAGLASLVLGYVLSQFYRAFLAVLSPVLGAEIGAGPEDLAVSLGLWYLAFAAMQLPVGRMLDTIGPRRTVAWPLAIGGGLGAAVFAMATGPWGVHLAMILIGVGCAPVLMGAYFVVARTLPAAAFGGFAGGIVAAGSLGNIAGTIPLVWVIEAIGWRAALWGMVGVALLAAAGVYGLLKDPQPAETSAQGNLRDVIRIPRLWAIIAMIFVGYTATAGLRGIWAGPYLSDVLGVNKTVLGWVTLGMGLMMILGNALYGMAERPFGSYRRAVMLGTLALIVALLAMALAPQAPLWQAAALICAVGLFGSAFPALMAHGRSFFPPHLLGRGVTLLNLFSIGGVGLSQFASRAVYRLALPAGEVAAYQALFGFYVALLALGLAAYCFSRTRP